MTFWVAIIFPWCLTWKKAFHWFLYTKIFTKNNFSRLEKIKGRKTPQVSLWNPLHVCGHSTNNLNLLWNINKVSTATALKPKLFAAIVEKTLYLGICIQTLRCEREKWEKRCFKPLRYNFKFLIAIPKVFIACFPVNIFPFFWKLFLIHCECWLTGMILCVVNCRRVFT